MSDGLVLSALGGSNPLAFLAALGTLRLLHLSGPENEIQMRWERCEGEWRPRLRGVDSAEVELCEQLMRAPWAPAEVFVREIGKNLTVPKEQFGKFARMAQETATREDRRSADFGVAFGCEVCDDPEKGRIEFTNFCFITGGGHQDFLGTLESLAKVVTLEHLRDALFGSWKLDKKFSMRWDPGDIAEYALQWGEPALEGAWAVWGANRLAGEALPLFPTMPQTSGLATSGFLKRERQWEFTWPIWTDFIGLDTVHSLLMLKEIQEPKPNKKMLHARGVAEVFRAQRVRVGQGANFKVSFRPARAV